MSRQTKEQEVLREELDELKRLRKESSDDIERQDLSRRIRQTKKELEQNQ